MLSASSQSAQLKSPNDRPGLAGVMEVTVEVVSSSGFTTSLHRCNSAVRLVMEGLLAHYFSPDRPTYVEEDVLWFLQLANDQEQWCLNPFLGEEEKEVELSAGTVEMSLGVVTGGYEDDLISKLEETVINPEKASAVQEEVSMGLITKPHPHFVTTPSSHVVELPSWSHGDEHVQVLPWPCPRKVHRASGCGT